MLKTYNAKVNWQATSKDMVNFLFFNGDKIKEGRAPGNALFEPTSARWNQGNYYTDNPLHGLWKIGRQPRHLEQPGSSPASTPTTTPASR